MIHTQGHVAGMPIEEVAAQLVPLGVVLLVGARLTGQRMLRRLRHPTTAARSSIRKEP